MKTYALILCLFLSGCAGIRETGSLAIDAKVDGRIVANRNNIEGWVQIKIDTAKAKAKKERDDFIKLLVWILGGGTFVGGGAAGATHVAWKKKVNGSLKENGK